MISTRLLCLFSLGCGCVPTLQAAPSRAPQPVVALQPFESGGPALVDAGDAGATPGASDAVDSRCAGANLDLDAIMKARICRVSEGAMAEFALGTNRKAYVSSPGAALKIEAAPLAPVAPGAVAVIELTLTNATDATRQVDFDYECISLGTTVTYANSNNRADYIDRAGCATIKSCSGPILRVELPAGGRMRATAKFVTRVTRLDEHCEELSAPMKPGDYTLHIVSPAPNGTKAERTVVADLHIR